MHGNNSEKPVEIEIKKTEKKDEFNIEDGKLDTNFEGVFDDIVEKYLK